MIKYYFTSGYGCDEYKYNLIQTKPNTGKFI